jgi:DNA-directed RNA polymerase subunit N (RpoN/RPB10)
MLYPRCPSCGTLLAHIELLYIKGMHEINNDNKKNDTKKKRNANIEKLLSGLVQNDCCRMRVITYSQLIKIVH